MLDFIMIVWDIQAHRVDREPKGLGLLVFPDSGELLYDEGFLVFGEGLGVS